MSDPLTEGETRRTSVLHLCCRDSCLMSICAGVSCEHDAFACLLAEHLGRINFSMNTLKQQTCGLLPQFEEKYLCFLLSFSSGLRALKSSHSHYTDYAFGYTISFMPYPKRSQHALLTKHRDHLISKPCPKQGTFAVGPNSYFERHLGYE